MRPPFFRPNLYRLRGPYGGGAGNPCLAKRYRGFAWSGILSGAIHSVLFHSAFFDMLPDIIVHPVMVPVRIFGGRGLRGRGIVPSSSDAFQLCPVPARILYVCHIILLCIRFFIVSLKTAVGILSGYAYSHPVVP